MSLKWSHSSFDQKKDDAYEDWLRNVADNFPAEEANYVVPAVWFGGPGLLTNFEEIFFSSGSGNTFSRSDLPPYVSESFLDTPPAFIADEVLPTHFPLDEWRDLLENRNPLQREEVDQVFVGRPVPADSVKYRGVKLEPLEPLKTEPDPDETPVIVAVIDEGLAFANERFRNGPTDSRVEFAWLQGGASAPVGVYGYNRGFELAKWDRTIDGKVVPGIDTLLERSLKGDLVDEDLFYKLAGISDFGRIHHKAAAWRVTHGTHVMDIAAGYDMAAEKPRRHIISVQLPPSIVADTSGLGLEAELINAVLYIFERAYEIRDRYGYKEVPPVVINFSSGIRAGPHDGSTSIEQYLDRVINYWRDHHSQVQMVLPAGNSFQARSHATFSFNKPSVPPGRKIDKVNWHVPPDDRTSSYIELWLPPDLDPAESKKISISISAPGDASFSGALVANPANPDKASVTLTDSGNGDSLVCKAYFQEKPIPLEISIAGSTAAESAGTGKRGRYLIAVVPTHFLDTDATLATAGVWTISVSYEGSEELEIHGWIHWDDAPISYSRFGRQSFFEDPHYEEFASDGKFQTEDDERSAIRRTGTINAIATGDQVRVVGAYRISDGRIADYSSADFKGRSERPNYLAPSETSRTNLGLLAAGSRSGSAVALNGTSVAAPQVARLIADLMASDTSDADIESYLKDKAIMDDPVVDKRERRRYPRGERNTQKERRGWGRLILDATRPSNALRGEFGAKTDNKP